MTQGSTSAGVLHWFVRGGVARTPDGTEVAIAPIVVGRDEGAEIRLSDPEVTDKQRVDVRAYLRKSGIEKG